MLTMYHKMHFKFLKSGRIFFYFCDMYKYIYKSEKKEKIEPSKLSSVFFLDGSVKVM